MQVLVFIGLKLAEIGGIILALYLCGFLGRAFFNWVAPNSITKGDGFFIYYVLPGILGFLLVLLIVLLLVFLVIIIYNLVQANWDWAGRILK